MKKVLLICGGGMSSSFLAKLLCDHLRKKTDQIDCSFAGAGEAMHLMETGEYDLFLEAPQIRHFHNKIEKQAGRTGSRLVQVPPLDYCPVPSKLDNIVKLIEENLQDRKP